MAEPLNMNIPMIKEDGSPTVEFEVQWFDVLQLVSGEPDMLLNVPIMADGRMTQYYENLWNGVAVKLSKDDVNIEVMMEENRLPTKEFEEYWNDLIT